MKVLNDTKLIVNKVVPETHLGPIRYHSEFPYFTNKKLVEHFFWKHGTYFELTLVPTTTYIRHAN